MIGAIQATLIGCGQLWTPAQMTTQLWFDAADSSTITKDGSNLISQWNDKSGNGRNVTASGDNRPTYSSNTLNGLAAISFVDGPYLVNSSYSSNFDNNNYFAVVKTNNYNGVSDGIFNAGDSSSLYINAHDSHVGIVKAGTSDYAGSTLSNAGPYIFVAGCSAPNAYMSLNGNSPNTISNFSSLGMGTGFYLGRLSNGAYKLNGYIAELIVTSGYDINTYISNVIGYLAWKWGLQDNLPSDHPYKYSAPRM